MPDQAEFALPAQQASVLVPHAVARWLAGYGVAEANRTAMTLIVGGQSNLTYRLELPDGRRWVLRRPPLGHVLATAHDVQREYRVLAALGPTGIPAPTVHGNDDGGVLGAPFFVMDYIDGVVPATHDSVGAGDEMRPHRVAHRLRARPRQQSVPDLVQRYRLPRQSGQQASVDREWLRPFQQPSERQPHRVQWHRVRLEP